MSRIISNNSDLFYFRVYVELGMKNEGRLYIILVTKSKNTPTVYVTYIYVHVNNTLMSKTYSKCINFSVYDIWQKMMFQQFSMGLN